MASGCPPDTDLKGPILVVPAVEAGASGGVAAGPSSAGAGGSWTASSFAFPVASGASAIRAGSPIFAGAQTRL